MMFSRSHLLVERDFERLRDDKIWGIEAYQLKEDNIFEWTAKIHGLKGTAWQGGVFRLYMKFDEHYNVRPPQLCFHTIPFHPNVDMVTGRPCVDFLDDWSQWKESYSLATLLLSIQVMLSSPVLENAVNSEAVSMILYSPHTYKQMVQDCVSASQRVEAGLIPHIDGSTVKIGNSRTNSGSPGKIHTQQIHVATRRLSKLSFEDYHTTWAGIATSKSSLNDKNPLLESLREQPNQQAAHYGVPVQDMQEQMQKQLQEHSRHVYGKFKEKNINEAQMKEAKMEKINQMKKIYLQPKSTPRRTPISLEEVGRENTRVEDEPWEEEVDDLMTWTNNLNADAL